MSAHDEDDEFFADIYGAKSSTEQPSQASSKQSASEAGDDSKNSSAVTNDPRTALLAESKPDSSAAAKPAQPEPSAATTETSKTAPSESGLAPEAPASSSGPAAGGFDPAEFAKQLQNLQQFQQGMNSGPGGSASGAMSGPSGDGSMSEQSKGHTEEGYHAGNIFIPAKDEGKMFIGGLNWETTDESMKNYFSTFGEVLEVNVMRDTNTGRSRGFGFLSFKDAKSVTEVLKREHFLDGKIIDPKRAIPREEQDKTAKIFVGGVGMDVTEEDFKNFFETFGTVIDAQLMIDKDTGRPRGFGFVTFDDHAAVDKIVSEKFLDLKGKSIEVKRAEPRLSREWQARNQQYRPMGQMGAMGAMAPMGAMPAMNPVGMGGMGAQPGAFPYANTAGMDPTMMSQYYQQWQNYMSQMQGMMTVGAGGVSSGSPSPNMESDSSDPRKSSMNNDGDRYEDRDPRRDRRRADDRRRSKSPPGGNRRRRGGAFTRDPRDRNYRRT